MRKPTFTIDARAYQSTLSRTFAGEQRPGLPSPVPTPKRKASDAMTLTPEKSFIGEVQNALKRTLTPKAPANMQDSLRKPATAKDKGVNKWAARLGLHAGSPKGKSGPGTP